MARYTYLLFAATREAREDSIKALTVAEGNALSAQANSEAAQRNADAAERLVGLTRDSMIRTLRAYVLMKRPFIPTHGPKVYPEGVELFVINTGQTPARDVTLFFLLEVVGTVPEMFDLTQAPLKYDTRQFGTLGKDQEGKLMAFHILSDNEANALRDLKAYQLVHGAVVYFDMLSNEQRISTFCYSVDRLSMQPYPLGPMNNLS